MSYQMQFGPESNSEVAEMAALGCPTDIDVSSWPELFARYQSLSANLAKLGGLLGTEQLADELTEEIEQVARAIAAHRAQHQRQIAQKLEIVLATMDETADPIAADLVRSAVADLRLVLHVV